MYYILHGEDEFSRSEEVKKMRAKMGDPQFADLNITLFDGRKVSLAELQHACDAVPFLSDKRLVIVEGMLARFDPRRKKSEEDAGEEIEEEANPQLSKELKGYLTQLTGTVRLVFVESKTLAKNNPILKHAESEKKKAYVKEFKVPAERALPKWIQERVNAKGGTIEIDAVNELAAHVGSGLRLLDNEIEKLLAYRGKEAIRADDVRALVASVRESNIFELVDALGRRETDVALNLLHGQLDHNAAPQYLLSMITRQFRLLLQVKDLAARGLTLNAAREQLQLHPFVAQKTWTQALNFTLPRLEAAHQKLLDTDLAIKTGRSEPVLALDVLIVDLTR
jgi:DNA polymerase-3 subunit delta